MLCLSSLLLLFPWGGDVQTLRLSPDRDNTLYESPTGSLSNGAGERLFAGLTNAGQLRRALLHFDLSVVPPGARITRATLHMNVSKVPLLPPLTTFRLHRVTSAWGEGASDAPGEEGTGAPSAPGDATWVHTFFPTDRWLTLGGDFELQASAKTVADQTLGPLAWSSSGMVADVQAWLSGEQPNHGWLIKAKDESVLKNAKRFDAREFAGSPEAPPRLELRYELGVVPCGVSVFCDVDPGNVGEVSVDTCSCDAGSLHVTLTGASPGRFTYLLAGLGSDPLPSPPGVSGELCLGGSPIARFVQDAGLTDASGAFSTDILNAATGGGGGKVPALGGRFCGPPGQTWNFQYWHRGGNPSVLSKALRVTLD